MKTAHVVLIAASASLVAGCATEPKTTFWEKKGDMVLVHHFDGLSDRVETLTKQKLPANTLKPRSFPTGQYFAVGQKEFHVKKVAPTPTKKTTADADKLAAVSKELRLLRNQISAVQAENHRLQTQLGDGTDTKTAETKTLSPANAAALREDPQLVEDAPRLSQ